MCIEPVSTMMLHGCYKATVNEPETITEAQRFCSVHRRVGLRTFGFWFSAGAPIERS
jgi:hypothetical protein